MPHNKPTEAFGSRQGNQEVTPKAQQLIVGGTKKGGEEGWDTQQELAHPCVSCFPCSMHWIPPPAACLTCGTEDGFSTLAVLAHDFPAAHATPGLSHTMNITGGGSELL